MVDNEISIKIIEEGNFENVFKDVVGNICFALPIPGFRFTATKDQNGDEQFTDFEWSMCSEAWEKFIKIQIESDEKKYRTKSNAGEIAEMPSTVPVITSHQYKNAITLNKDKNAHLQQVEADVGKNLKFKDGKLYFQGLEASAARLVDKFTDENLSDIDLPLIRALYGVILKNIKFNAETLLNKKSRNDMIGYTVNIYLPDFFKMIGLDPKINKSTVAYAVEKISNFNRILGIMQKYYPEHGRTYKSIYPIMVFMGYNEKNNTIHFASPYMNLLIWDVLHDSIKTDKQGKPKLNKKGEPLMLPAHSFLIKGSLAGERNVRAAEIVCIIVTLIEQAGDNTPHIKASTIIERHPALKQALDEKTDMSNKNQLLKRTFTTAWKYLRKHTTLEERYKNIKLPSEKQFPTMSTLDMIFEFPHDGKSKN